MASLNPVGKVAYLCDELLRDPNSGKVYFLGVFDDVILPPIAAYPYRLRKMCVVAQLTDYEQPNTVSGQPRDIQFGAN
jgi:hypothetical protein